MWRSSSGSPYRGAEVHVALCIILQFYLSFATSDTEGAARGAPSVGGRSLSDDFLTEIGSLVSEKVLTCAKEGYDERETFSRVVSTLFVPMGLLLFIALVRIAVLQPRTREPPTQYFHLAMGSVVLFAAGLCVYAVTDGGRSSMLTVTASAPTWANSTALLQATGRDLNATLAGIETHPTPVPIDTNLLWSALRPPTLAGEASEGESPWWVLGQLTVERIPSSRCRFQSASLVLSLIVALIAAFFCLWAIIPVLFQRPKSGEEALASLSGQRQDAQMWRCMCCRMMSMFACCSSRLRAVSVILFVALPAVALTAKVTPSLDANLLFCEISDVNGVRFASNLVFATISGSMSIIFWFVLFRIQKSLSRMATATKLASEMTFDPAASVLRQQALMVPALEERTRSRTTVVPMTSASSVGGGTPHPSGLSGVRNPRTSEHKPYERSERSGQSARSLATSGVVADRSAAASQTVRLSRKTLSLRSIRSPMGHVPFPTARSSARYSARVPSSQLQHGGRVGLPQGGPAHSPGQQQSTQRPEDASGRFGGASISSGANAEAPQEEHDALARVRWRLKSLRLYVLWIASLTAMWAVVLFHQSAPMPAWIREGSKGGERERTVAILGRWSDATELTWAVVELATHRDVVSQEAVPGTDLVRDVNTLSVRLFGPIIHLGLTLLFTVIQFPNEVFICAREKNVVWVARPHDLDPSRFKHDLEPLGAVPFMPLEGDGQGVRAGLRDAFWLPDDRPPSWIPEEYPPVQGGKLVSRRSESEGSDAGTSPAMTPTQLTGSRRLAEAPSPNLHDPAVRRSVPAGADSPSLQGRVGGSPLQAGERLDDGSVSMRALPLQAMVGPPLADPSAAQVALPGAANGEEGNGAPPERIPLRFFPPGPAGGGLQEENVERPDHLHQRRTSARQGKNK